MAILEIENLCVSYGKVEAVRNVSLQLEEGEIVSIIGPNGAGKTTMLMAVIGLLRCKGQLKFFGQNLNNQEVETRVENGLCLVPEQRELFGELTVLENLKMGAYAHRLNKASFELKL